MEVKGLEEALQRARMADFYNALAAPNGRFAVSGQTAVGAPRTCAEIAPIADLPQAAGIAAARRHLRRAAASFTGRVITAGVQANMRSAERQRDSIGASCPASLPTLQIRLSRR